ncbi:MAG: hypothetical protein ACTHU0_06060, partial [Kofleriaceae bacterium]
VDATGRDGAAVIARALARERKNTKQVGGTHSQPELDAVLTPGGARPVVIASGTGAAADVVRRARAAGADLAVTRPHDAERLALVLLAATRLVEQRRDAGARPEAEHVPPVHEQAPHEAPAGAFDKARGTGAARAVVERVPEVPEVSDGPFGPFGKALDEGFDDGSDDGSDDAVEVDLDDDPELASSLDEGADDDLLDASADDVLDAFPDDALDASRDDVLDASSDDVVDAAGDDVLDASADDVLDASADDVLDAFPDDALDASRVDVLDASRVDVLDAAVDDVVDASADDVVDASADDVLDASADDVLDASADDVLDASSNDGLADSEPPGFESDPAWSAFDLDLDSDPDGAGSLLSFEQVERQLEVELELSQRHGHPISIAMLELVPPTDAPPGVSGILRARAGIAVAGAIREIDIAAPLPSDGSPERFLIVLPDTSRGDATDVARRVLEAVSAIDPVVAAGRALPAQVIGAVVTAEADPPRSVVRQLRDASRALDQARREGADLAVPP